jgi:tRNA pseudouridine55 synthase
VTAPAGRTEPEAGIDGLLVVDKPAGWTSHDVVGRIRRLAGTRRVGHAGTLDPMATGVLVVGVGRATRLLGHLALADKDYDATIRLGVTTTTDDAEGEILTGKDASGVTDEQLVAAMSRLTGDIEQVPSAVSAVKVDGERAYKRARRGEEVKLRARPVHVARFELVARHGADVDVAVSCSTGTYVRALARDVGAALGVGAHLTALRRTRVGGFGLDRARTLEQLADDLSVVPLADAVAAAFPRVVVSDDDARRLVFGQPVHLSDAPTSPFGVFAPDGAVVAVGEQRDGRLRTLVVFASSRRP